MKKYYKLIISGLLIVLVFILKPLTNWATALSGIDFSLFVEQQTNLSILGFTWFSILVIRFLKARLLKQYDLSQEDNLDSRKLHTQVNILEKVVVFVIIILATSLILLSFDSIREIGIGIFASAGVAGIIIGLSAQKVVGALLAGIQIAITQPFRIDDAVLVENEWGGVGLKKSI